MTPMHLGDGPATHPLRYDRLVWYGGLAGLGLVFAGGLAVALAAPMWAWLLPVAALAGAGLAALPRRASTLLLLQLGLFSLVSGHSEGLDPEEILFAAGQFGYLAWWFWTRVFVYRLPLLRDLCDVVMFGFLLYIPLSLGLTALFSGSLSLAATECLSLSMLALYFPFREVIETEENGLRIVVAVVLAFGLIGTIRVLGSVRSALADAEYAWQVAQGRVPMNETLLYSASLLTLCLASLARNWKVRALIIGGFTLFTLGLIMTQWRAYYIGWVIGVCAILVWGSPRVRRQTIGLGMLASVVGSLLAIAVLGQTFIVAAVGIAERILSIGSANSSDISLLNRYLEYEALWPVLLESPVFGHGPGVTFAFYDAIFKGTWVKSYAHNTYLLVWFKFGLVGLAAFVGVWGYTLRSAVRLRRTSATAFERACALFVAAALAGLAVSSLVSVALVTDDTAYNFAVLFAIGAGLRARSLRSGVQ